MTQLLLAFLLVGPPGFYASDREPRNAEWSRFRSFAASQRSWTRLYATELGMCIDVAMCLGPGERVFELDTPPGFEVETVVAFAGKDSHAARLLVELPVEMTGDPSARTHLLVLQGKPEPDSLIVLGKAGAQVTMREKKR